MSLISALAHNAASVIEHPVTVAEHLPSLIERNAFNAVTGSLSPTTTTSTQKPSASTPTVTTSTTPTTSSGSTGGDTSDGTSTSTLASDISPYLTEGSDALTAALSALSGTNSSAQDAYNTAVNELDSEQAGAQNTENDTLNTDTSDLATSEQEAREQGNSDQSSLMRALAALGAGSSSVGTELIPSLVQQSVENNIQGADQTKAQNDSNAITAYNTWLDNTLNPGLATDKDTLQNTENTAQATYKQEVNELKGAIAALKGATDSDQVSDDGEILDDDYHDITPVVVPATNFTGNVATYQAPTLSTYELTPTQIAAAAGQVANPTGTVLPILAVNGQQQKQNTSTTPVVVPAS